MLYFMSNSRGCQPREDDFRCIADWGFDFVRLPMNYRAWSTDDDPLSLNEEVLGRVDAAVSLGRAHGIHVDLSFHRAPGYCVNKGMSEPFMLWTDEAALEAFCFHWAHFAQRYKGIPASELSFNLVNEPAAVDGTDGLTPERHEHVIRTALKAIHGIDPARLVIADGVTWGNDPVPALAGLPLAQSCRGYVPMQISHYQASWVDGERFDVPTWPTTDQGEGVYDRARLAEHFAHWRDLADAGVGVHCGECGCFNKTPHAVFLNWFESFLQILRGLNIGWALWNLDGAFGVLDSARADVAYENWRGHKLDRALLDLLRRY